MSNNITITFPDGNTKSVEKGISGFDLANQISKSLAKESVAIQIDGKICDLSLELSQDCRVVIIKRENEEALDIIRHDCAHVMAEAVQSLFPRKKGLNRFSHNMRTCLLYTSPSPRDLSTSRMPSSA